MIDNIQTEWQDLPNLQAVAKAQADKWEIEIHRLARKEDGWRVWIGESWDRVHKYRGRPRQPVMKEIKMECWLNNGALHWFIEGSWKHGSRQPHLDMIARVPE